MNNNKNKHIAFLAGSDIKAGFPSPADDFLDIPLDLNKKLIQNPPSTFFVRVQGDSMIGARINNGDLLIVDKSLSPLNGDIAICYLNGEFTVKQLKFEKNSITLMPANDKYTPIIVSTDSDFMIWGIVRHIIKSIR